MKKPINQKVRYLAPGILGSDLIKEKNIKFESPVKNWRGRKKKEPIPKNIEWCEQTC